MYKLCDIFATGQIQFHKHDFVSTTKMAISTPVVSERGFPDIIKAHGKILHRQVSVWKSHYVKSFLTYFGQPVDS